MVRTVMKQTFSVRNPLPLCRMRHAKNFLQVLNRGSMRWSPMTPPLKYRRSDKLTRPQMLSIERSRLEQIIAERKKVVPVIR